MKRFMAVGRVSAGKTTLTRLLEGLPSEDKKTQTAETVGQSIDTPGEYLEHRGFYRALVVLSVEAEAVLLLQSCTDPRTSFPPGVSAMFARPVVGVVTKIDLAQTPDQIETARRHLMEAGAERIFPLSSVTGEGIEALRSYLSTN